MLLSTFEVEFEEVQESLRQEGLTERLSQYSPTARVPVLIDESVTVLGLAGYLRICFRKIFDG